MDFLRLPDKPRYKGLKLSRRPNQGIFVAETGILTFTGYKNPDYEVGFSTRNFY